MPGFSRCRKPQRETSVEAGDSLLPTFIRHIVLIPYLSLVCSEELVVSRLQYALKETEKEYLLFVPYTLKDRAKAIEGRHWDRDRGCWIYSRTARIFDTLIA